MIERRARDYPHTYANSRKNYLFFAIFSQITLAFARDASSQLFNPITKQAIFANERTNGHIKNSIQDVDDASMKSARKFSCNRAQKNLKLKCHRAFAYSIVTQLAIHFQPFIILFLPYLFHNLIHVPPNSHPQFQSDPIPLPPSSNLLRISITQNSHSNQPNFIQFFYTIAFKYG